MTPERASIGSAASARLREAMRLSVLREYGIVVSFLVLFLTLTFSSSAFLSRTNLLNILSQEASLVIIATAGTLVIISGGFDIAIGSVYALSGVIGTKIGLDLGPYEGMVLGVAVGLGAGLLNGIAATVGRINSLIATLASGFIFGGIALVITGGATLLIDNPTYTGLGQNTILGVQIAIWIMLLWIAALWFLLTRTVLGRFIFAAGDNPEAARLAGVRVNVVRTVAFMLSGLGAGLGGVIDSSRFQSGAADVGADLVFTVIAGIVVGGTSILGGEGAIWRTVLGVLFIALIGNGFTLLAVDPIYQQIVEGGIIIGAVGLDAWTRYRRA